MEQSSTFQAPTHFLSHRFFSTHLSTQHWIDFCPHSLAPFSHAPTCRAPSFFSWISDVERCVCNLHQHTTISVPISVPARASVTNPTQNSYKNQILNGINDAIKFMLLASFAARVDFLRRCRGCRQYRWRGEKERGCIQICIVANHVTASGLSR